MADSVVDADAVVIIVANAIAAAVVAVVIVVSAAVAVVVVKPLNQDYRIITHSLRACTVCWSSPPPFLSVLRVLPSFLFYLPFAV